MDKQEVPKKPSYYSCTATRYQWPKLPDVLPMGHATMAVLGTSHGRRVNLNVQPAIPTRRRRFRFPRGKPVLVILLGAFLALAILLFLQQVAIPWGNSIKDQWNYGDAHVTQLDADVGHGGVSHFLAEYYQGNIVIIEISLSNPNNTHVYTLSGVWDSGTNTPVILLSVEGQNHNGKPNLRISVEGTNFTTVLYNNGTTFQQSEG